MIDILGISTLSFVAGAVVLVVGSVTALAYFLTKEERFEDVVEAQRREQEELLQSLSTSQSGKSKKKYGKPKGKQKASEEKLIQNVLDIVEKANDTVDLGANEVKPTPVEAKQELPKASKTTNATTKTASVGKKGNPKASKQPIVEEDFVIVTEDAAELQAAPPSLSTTDQTTKSKKAATSTQNGDSHHQNAPLREDTGPKKAKTTAKPKKKARKDVFDLEATLEAIQVDHLGKSDLQLITETLIAKQAGIEDWKTGNQKGDASELQKKQLQQMTDELDRERSNAQACAGKVKDLRQELEQMKAQCKLDIAKASAKIAEEAKEKDSLRRRLDTLTKSHNAEMQELVAQRGKHSVDCSPAELQKLREENLQFKNASLMAQQLSVDKNSLMKELDQIQQKHQHLRAEMESVRSDSDNMQNKYKEQIIAYDRELTHVKNELAAKHSGNADKHKAEENMAKLSENIRHLTMELEKSKQENTQLKHNLDQEKSSKDLLESSCKGLEDEKSSLLTQLQQVQLKEQQTQAEIQQLSSQKENLQGVMNELQSNKPQSDGALANITNQLQASQDALKAKSDELDKLQEKETEVSTELKHVRGVVDNLKQKNNELREKNWKAMDALDNAEKASSEKVKACKYKVIKCIKAVRPDYKADGQAELEDLLDQFQNNCAGANDQDSQKIQLQSLSEENCTLKSKVKELESANTERQTLASENSSLKSQVEELKSKVKECLQSQTAAEADLLSAINDKDSYKSVLELTEAMLKDLQDTVEVELAAWQQKVSKLEDALKEAPSSEAVEADLTKLRKELNEAMLANRDLSSKFEDMTNSNKKLDSEKAGLTNELSKVKEELSSRNAEISNLNKNKEQLEQSIETMKNEAAKQQKSNTIQVVSSVTANNTDKDKTIARLTLENAELRDELREEREQIVVDVAPAVGTEQVEDLNDQLEELRGELTKAKENNTAAKKTSDEMSTQLANLTKQNEELNKKLQELETARSQEIEKAIDEAIGQVTTKLNDRERQLEDEKQTTTQLRLQVAALKKGQDNEGTSV